MKFTNKLFALLLALVILTASVSIAVSAEGEKGAYLVDMADLFTESEEADLSKKLSDASDKLCFDIVFVTTSSTDGLSITKYTDDFYLNHNYAYDAIVFCADMSHRQTHFTTSGKCIKIFTDYGLDYLLEKIGGYLKDGDYVGAVEKLIDYCESYKAEADKGTPYDTNHKVEEDPVDILIRFVISLIIAIVVAFIVTGTMKSALKSVRKQSSAANYTRLGSMNVTQSRDLFLYTNVTRTAIPKSSSGGGGGSSTHSSGGRSLGGRSGSF